jgi:hypothetical protein
MDLLLRTLKASQLRTVAGSPHASDQNKAASWAYDVQR